MWIEKVKHFRIPGNKIFRDDIRNWFGTWHNLTLDLGFLGLLGIIFGVRIFGLQATGSELLTLLRGDCQLSLHLRGLGGQNLCLCAAASSSRLNVNTSGLRSLLLLDTRHAARGGPCRLNLFWLMPWIIVLAVDETFKRVVRHGYKG